VSPTLSPIARFLVGCTGSASQTSVKHIACAVVHCAGLSVGALAQRHRQAAGVRFVAHAVVYCRGLSVGALAQRLGQAAGVRCVAYVIAYRAVLSGEHWLSVTDKRQARETYCLRRCPLRRLESGCTGSAQRLGQAAVVTCVAYAIAYRAVLSRVQRHDDTCARHVACAVVYCAGLSVVALHLT
jgi:hypothetical protein